MSGPIRPSIPNGLQITPGVQLYLAARDIGDALVSGTPPPDGMTLHEAFDRWVSDIEQEVADQPSALLEAQALVHASIRSAPTASATVAAMALDKAHAAITADVPMADRISAELDQHLTRWLT